MIGTAAQRTERRNVIGSAMEGLDAKRTFARLQLEGEEFLLTSLFIELAESPKTRNGDKPSH